MADEALERITILLQARDKDLQRAIERNTREVRKFTRGATSETKKMASDIDRHVSSVGNTIMGMGKSFAVGLGAGVVTAAFAGITTNLAEIVHGVAEVGDQAKRSGLGVQAFQEWKFVAEQNRIGIDALVDGFKELSLRADEFVVTGGGSAAESFARLGYSGAELAAKLKDPSALMLEIIGRLGAMDKAAQIRISDELFGGSAGERFVELLGQGERGISATIARAHEAGAVLDTEMIQKAAELDRKFAELKTTAASFFKGFAVNAAEFVDDVVSMNTKLDDLFGGEGKARAALGGQLYDGIKGNQQVINDQAEALGQLKGQYDQLAETAGTAAMSFASASSLMDSWGYDDASNGLAAVSNEMRALIEEYRAGTVEGADFATKMEELRRRADEAFGALDASDRVNFGGAISEVDRLGGVLLRVTGLAQSLGRAVAAAAGMTLTAGNLGAGEDADKAVSLKERRDAEAAVVAKTKFLALQDQENAKSAAQLELDKAIAAFRERAAKAGVTLTDAEAQAGGAAAVTAGAARNPRSGGKADKPGAFADQVTDTEQKIAAWQAEAASLVAVAAAGKAYGTAVEYARKRAELLQAAQQQGLAITPELTAQIDGLAKSYASAGQSAEVAADKLDMMQKNAERGADALSGIFTSVLTSAKSGREAVADLLAEIAKIQMQKAVAGIFSGGAGGGFLGALGGLLGFDGGGYTGDRARSGGVDGKGGFLAVMHPRETVIDHTKPPGNVSAGQQSGGGGALDVRVGFDNDGNLQAYIARTTAGISARMVQAGAAAQQRALPGTIAGQQARGT